MSSGEDVKHERIFLLFRLMRKRGMGIPLFFKYFVRAAMLWEIGGFLLL